MKEIKAIVLLFLFLIITSIALADWKSDITKLGFYAVVSGKAIPLEFVVFMDDDTERNFLITEFKNIPSLKKDDFLVLYGDMPKGPLDTSVEVFKYTLKGSAYKYSGNAGEVSDFFSLEPLGELKREKLSRLIPRLSIDDILWLPKDGIYALHKYVGMSGDGYAGFKIMPAKPLLSFSGTYYRENNKSDYLEFKQDGTFILKEERGWVRTGEYRYDGEYIYRPSMGKIDKGKIEGDIYIEESGARWRKKKERPEVVINIDPAAEEVKGQDNAPKNKN
jgi:hypothetical protein